MESKLRIGCKFSFLNITYQFQKEPEMNCQLNFMSMVIGVGSFGRSRGCNV
jgi:hypothetical protein